jgi:hypothetical protein
MTIGHATRPAGLVLALGLLATYLAVQSMRLTHAALDFTARVPQAWPAFGRADVEGMSMRLACVVGILAAATLGAALLAVVRSGWVLRYIQGLCIAGYLATVYAVACATKAVAVYAATGIPFRGLAGDECRAVQFFMQVGMLKWVVPALAGFAVVHLATARRGTIALYTGHEFAGPALGDRFIEDLRTGGNDPEFRKCWTMSLGTHAAAILLLPLLFHAGGCATRTYDPPPKVDAGPERVVIKVIKRPPKIAVDIHNPRSPIAFPPADVFRLTKLPSDIDRETQKQYEVDMNRLRVGTAPGNNGSGSGLGWPGGKGGGKVVFMRLSYAGDGWNDGMQGGQPSLNLLRELRKAFPGVKVDYSERVETAKGLAQYPKGYAPAFVYMTGEGRIDMSDSEVRALRQYLNDGGMLFADCGSAAFHQSFCSLVSRVMPGEIFARLPDDDEIFNTPFFFQNGAPPLWHHGGERAMGVRIRGRLCVFYHPGDLNDAWKTGRSGTKAENAELAFRMGMNVMYYAFKNYAQVAAKYRK